MQCFLPTIEETSITINFRDGQAPITIDAIELDDMTLQIKKDEFISFEEQIAKLFFQKYQRRISPTAARFLIQAKHQKITEAKKNLFLLPEPSATTTPEAPSQAEN